MELQVLLEFKVVLEQPDHLVLLGLLARQVHREPLEHLAQVGQWEPLEPQVNLDRLVLLDSLDLLVQLDLQEHKELLGQVALLASLERLDLWEPPAQLGQLELRVPLVQLGFPVHLAHLGVTVSQDLEVALELLAHLEPVEQRGPPDQLGHKALEVKPEELASLVLQDPLGSREQLGQLDSLGHLDQPVLLDQQEPLELQEDLEHREPPDPRVRLVK